MASTAARATRNAIMSNTVLDGMREIDALSPEPASSITRRFSKIASALETSYTPIKHVLGNAAIPSDKLS